MLQPLNDQDSGYGEITEPPPSLWRLVEEQVPPSERAEIKRILGEAAVDLSLDLHTEVEVLLDVWREVQARALPPVYSSPSRCSILADPPVIKEMVTQEIRMLLLSVRSNARHRGLDEEQALSKYNPKVVTYVMGAGRPDSRAGARESRCGSRPGSASRTENERPKSSLSTGSSIEDNLEELRDKLKVLDIDKIIHHLQSLLEDECQSLKKDIVTLQQYLEEDSIYAEELQTLPEPSLTELKEERRVIERDLQRDQLSVPKMESARDTLLMRSTPLTRWLDGGRSDSLGSQDFLVLPQRPTSSKSHPHDLTQGPYSTSVKPKATAMIRSTPWSHKEPPPVEQEPASGEYDPSKDPRFASRTSSMTDVTRGTGQTRVRSPDALYCPAPPPTHRPPSGASSGPAFRRVRVLVPNTPP
ncbi:coiled-coil domain-containing protein 24 [Gastrophryne carolinensis]